MNVYPISNLLQQKPRSLSMPVDEIHVWQVMLTHAKVFTDEFWQVLGVAEKQKALRFRSETDQARSIVSRGFLRNILAWYLDMKPASIEFSYGTLGKPFLASGHGLEFNMTHSDDLILYVFTFGRQVGIDLEHESKLPELYSIARHFFSRREQDLLASLPALEQKETFFKLWTLREAYGKMRGDGFTDELKDVDILSILEEQNDWTFETFAPLPRYAATMVAEGSVRSIVHFIGYGIAG